MAQQTRTGVVREVTAKPWNGRNGPITLYSFQLENDRNWYRTGTDLPNVQAGEAVRFTYDDSKNQVDVSTITKVEAGTVEAAPAPPAAPASAPRKSGGEDWNARQKYWDAKERRDIEVVEPRITYSAAQRDAIAAVEVMLNNGALALGNAKAADKMEMILDAIDKVADRFYTARFALTFVEDTYAEESPYGEE